MYIAKSKCQYSMSKSFYLHFPKNVLQTPNLLVFKHMKINRKGGLRQCSLHARRYRLSKYLLSRQYQVYVFQPIYPFAVYPRYILCKTDHSEQRMHQLWYIFAIYVQPNVYSASVHITYDQTANQERTSQNTRKAKICCSFQQNTILFSIGSGVLNKHG